MPLMSSDPSQVSAAANKLFYNIFIPLNYIIICLGLTRSPSSRTLKNTVNDNRVRTNTRGTYIISTHHICQREGKRKPSEKCRASVMYI